MEINCIIIDDELPAIRQMESYVDRVPFLKHLHSFDNGIEPINFLKTNKVDLIFLDIEMENFTGLQFIKTLVHKPKIILTTAYDQYAIEAFNLNVTDYLLKPISFERFLQAVDKIFDHYSEVFTLDTGAPQYRRDFTFIKTEFRLQRVDFKDILFIMGQKEYLQVHTYTERIMTLMSFREMEEILPAHEFARVHKSWIVAIAKIESIERHRIYIGEHIIPVSENYRDEFYRMIREKNK
jgi:DNA-binding LytR/AlgR family response regulator